MDYYFNWEFILKDVIKRPFITLGFTSFFLLVPLALTSTNVMVKKLTYKVWKNIHELIGKEVAYCELIFRYSQQEILVLI